jgi:hypothetical protein
MGKKNALLVQVILSGMLKNPDGQCQSRFSANC